jgi:(p)ppGpp synthase/HD superfamily hydrolase
MSKIDKALEIATRIYRGKTDKNGDPLILHALRVMVAVEHLGEDAMIVGLLHDVFEEEPGIGPLYYLDRGISPDIMAAVMVLTRSEKRTYFEYIERILKSGSNLPTLVKIKDLQDNLDEARMARLPHEERMSLKKRYKKALNMLGVKT